MEEGLGERRQEMRRLLLGVTSGASGEASRRGSIDLDDDQLGIKHVLDRWSQVLTETLPPCPWTAVSKNGAFVDVKTVSFESLEVVADVISGEGEGTEVQVPLEDVVLSAQLNDDLPEQTVSR